jgi:hypothetical protein
MIALGLLCGTPPAGATVSCPTDTLAAGHKLVSGRSGTTCSTLQSRGGRFVLYVDPNGLTMNQRLTPTGYPLTALQTETGPTWSEYPLDGVTHPGLALALRSSGNLVLVTPSGTVLWATNTAGSGAVFATVRASGKLVLLTASGKVVWRSDSGVEALGGDDRVNPGGRLVSTSNYFSGASGSLHNAASVDTGTMQTDGNFVYRCGSPARVVWQTNTHRPGSSLVMEQTGALVIKGPHGSTLWSSPTTGTRHAYAVLGIEVSGARGLAWRAHLASDSGC